MNYVMILIGGIIGIIVGNIVCYAIDYFLHQPKGSSPVWSASVAKARKEIEEEVKK